MYLVLKFQPVPEVAFEGFHSFPMLLLSIIFSGLGLYLMIRAKLDQVDTP